ncbi:MAG: hypothetical protein JO354_05710 [Verrucomicrobia bacterium]|nr:hypothetical protein [Verrucomicrobiota bacterium]
MKTAAEKELAEALRTRLAIIADENSRRNPEAQMQRLREVSQQIEKLSTELPRPVNPQLTHFLSRRSYEKALELLLEYEGKTL